MTMFVNKHGYDEKTIGRKLYSITFYYCCYCSNQQTNKSIPKTYRRPQSSYISSHTSCSSYSLHTHTGMKSTWMELVAALCILESQ